MLFFLLFFKKKNILLLQSKGTNVIDQAFLTTWTHFDRCDTGRAKMIKLIKTLVVPEKLERFTFRKRFAFMMIPDDKMRTHFIILILRIVSLWAGWGLDVKLLVATV